MVPPVEKLSRTVLGESNEALDTIHSLEDELAIPSCHA